MDWDFKDIRIAVIGDHNLDIDFVGDYTGLMSREQESLAIVTNQPSDVHISGGGAANITEMLSYIGVGNIFPIGVWNTWYCTWSKMLYRRYNDLLEPYCSSWMVSGMGTPCFIKFYRPSGVHIFRANVASEEMTPAVESSLIDMIGKLHGRIDAVIVADYDEDGRGVITPGVIKAIDGLSCLKFGLSRSRITRLQHYDYLILDLQELYSLTGMSPDESLGDHAKKMFGDTAAKNIVVTLEGNGVILFEAESVALCTTVRFVKETVIATVPLECNIDTCGCGDAFTAFFVATVLAGCSHEVAMQGGNALARAQARELYGAREIGMEEVQKEYEELYGG